MRRFCATLITAWLSLLLMLPVVFPNTAQARVPACCRASGRHHCSQRQPSAPGWQAIPAPCSQLHVDGALPVLSGAAPAQANVTFSLDLIPHHQIAAQPDTLYRLAFSRSRQKRGPPAFFA